MKWHIFERLMVLVKKQQDEVVTHLLHKNVEKGSGRDDLVHVQESLNLRHQRSQLSLGQYHCFL